MMNKKHHMKWKYTTSITGTEINSWKNNEPKCVRSNRQSATKCIDGIGYQSRIHPSSFVLFTKTRFKPVYKPLMMETPLSSVFAELVRWICMFIKCSEHQFTFDQHLPETKKEKMENRIKCKSEYIIYFKWN